MTTIYERINDALTALATPMAPSVYVVSSGSSRPDLYLVYFVVTAPPVQHADDIEKERNYLVQINIFSKTGLQGLPDVQGAMSAAGFTAGAMRDMPYSPETGHYGLSMDFNYLETV